MLVFRKKAEPDRKKVPEKMEICEPYLQVGDREDGYASLIVQGRNHFAIIEGGVVIWTGDCTQFSRLIRTAARSLATGGAA